MSIKQQLQDLIDDQATPVTLDEVLNPSTTPAAPGVEESGGDRRTAPLLVAAAAAVALVFGLMTLTGNLPGGDQADEQAVMTAGDDGSSVAPEVEPSSAPSTGQDPNLAAEVGAESSTHILRGFELDGEGFITVSVELDGTNSVLGDQLLATVGFSGVPPCTIEVRSAPSNDFPTPQPPIADTAVVLTNALGEEAIVTCDVFEQSEAVAARVRPIEVPSMTDDALRYAVEPGDTITGIALLFNVSPEAIYAVNPGMDGSLLQVGQLVQIPEGDFVLDGPPSPPASPEPAATPIPRDPGEPLVYQVQAGDTLAVIASIYGVTIDALMAANDLVDPDTVIIGDQLLIPPPIG